MSAAEGRRFRPLRDLPVAGWLAAAAVVALVHPFVPAPRWLMIHLLLLGAASHAILVWSRFFADALLHREGDSPRRQSARLALLNGGVVGVVLGVLTGRWPVVVLAAGAVAGAVLWHGGALAAQLRRALPARFRTTVHYYVTAAGLLPVGAFLGVLLARGLTETSHLQVVTAHAVVNVLGWIGLTVLGTLTTLWPTMLRTRIAEGAERAAARALPVLAGSVVVAIAAALSGLRLGVALAVLGYVAGVALAARPFVEAMLRKPPREFATWSVLAGVGWLLVCLLALVTGFAVGDSWQTAGLVFDRVTPFLAGGFAGQVLLGALSYLVPVALGGGPTPVRAATAVLDRGSALRIATVNAGLLVCVLPVPSAVRVACAVLVLAGLVSFLPLLVLGIRASRRAKVVPVETRAPAPRKDRGRPRGQLTGHAAAGLAVVVLAAAAGVAWDPAALAGAARTESAAAGVAPTGDTTIVQMEAVDMRFSPSTISIPAGNRLVIELTNADEVDIHDIVLDSGDRTPRLAPGESARLDLGVVGRDLEGWCSVVGHREMGMVMRVDVRGPAAAAAADGDSHDHADHAHGPAADHAPAAGPDHHDTGSPGIGGAATGRGAAESLDFRAAPAAGFTPYDASLPPLGEGRVHRHTLTVRDTVREVAPGVTQRLWTYNGTAPGPMLHGRVGDVFEIRLVNDGSIGHSIDFHAGSLAPDRPMRTIQPGQSLVYRFRATMAGIWMYHCSSMPMSAHIANGMFGAVVIEPPGLRPVDRSYLLVQSEIYVGDEGGPVDAGKVSRERPDAVVFNGYANQYDHRPLRARVGERVRMWVLDAGPNRASSFHVVGSQFDTVYAEGAYLLDRGSGGAQSLALQPGQGGFVELTFPEPGDYPFVSHLMVDAERGAHGVVRVVR